MISELNSAAFETVRPLFQPLTAYLPFCAGVIEGNYSGRIFVDDLNAPTSAFMVTRDVWCYLAGNPNNAPFIDSLNRDLMGKKILPEDAFGMLLCCHPEQWDTTLPTVCAPAEPRAFGRRRYILQTFSNSWHDNIPEEFHIRQIDASFAERPSAELPDDVKSLLAMWQDAPHPEEKGFGFVALHQDKIVCHAVVDCLVNGIGDVGLVTHEDFRRRGLASVTAAAAVEYGLSHGLDRINWDCSAENEPSIRVAEKLGFTHERNHTIIYVKFPHTENS